MKNIILICFLFISFGTISQSTENELVMEPINRLFAAMKIGDSTLVKTCFYPNAKMQSISFSKKQNKDVLSLENELSGFLEAVGTPHAEIYDERVLKTDIKIDGSLATVWAEYEFWLGSKFLHCGVDHFTLFKENGHWKIIYLADTRRTTDCKQ